MGESVAEETLKASEVLYHTTIDALDSAVYVVDSDLRFRLVNAYFKGWCDELGLGQADFVGQSLPETFVFLPERICDEYEHVFKTGEVLVTEENVAVGDRKIVVERRIIPVFEGEKVSRVVTVMTDITGRKQAEKALAWEASISAVVAGLSSALLSTASLEDISFLVLEYARQFTDSRYGYVGYIDPNTGYLVCPTMTRGIWDTCQVADKKFVFEKFGGLWGWVLDNRQSLLTNAPSGDSRSSGVPEGHIPIYRFLSAPALVGGRLVGQVAVANSHRDYTEQDLVMVERLASLYALAVQRKQAEDRLRLQSAALESAANAIVIADREGRISWVNPAFTRLTGYTIEEVIGQNPRILKSGEHDASFYREFWETILSGQVWRGEVTNRRKDGSLYVEEMTITPVHDGEGELSNFIAIKQDVTERKKAEEEIKASLREKEVLLKEIHHRVKNNLQIVSSLLNLQAGYIEDRQALAVFKESQDRVRSMALLHEKLYQSQSLAMVDFSEYIHSLAAQLFRSYVVNAAAVELKIEVSKVLLDVDTAIPCGLLINELVSNALKHAFPGGREGEVSIKLYEDGERYTLIVSDNGIGLPEDVDFRSTGSLGLQLVSAMAEDDLEGTIELDRSNGTTFKITFHKSVISRQ